MIEQILVTIMAIVAAIGFGSFVKDETKNKYLGLTAGIVAFLMTFSQLLAIIHFDRIVNNLPVP